MPLRNKPRTDPIHGIIFMTETDFLHKVPAKLLEFWIVTDLEKPPIPCTAWATHRPGIYTRNANHYQPFKSNTNIPNPGVNTDLKGRVIPLRALNCHNFKWKETSQTVRQQVESVALSHAQVQIYVETATATTGWLRTNISFILEWWMGFNRIG
jgi:hypothetical protein